MAHQHLASRHTHPHTQAQPLAWHSRIGQALTNTQRTAHRPFRIVLMRDHAAKQGHHPITRRLCYDAAGALNLTT